ncbi:Metallo-dependent phosphatase-like protein [Chytriomyces cf. hyalinus JEL632]|nr:Metallo-dependent phosphatase-like protein [Chytriomyces cf. hyalinus JEL632]
MARGPRITRFFLNQLHRNPFRVIWVLNVIICEFIVARYYMHSCSWPSTGKEGGKDVHVALIADPQLTDAYSYRMNPGTKLSLVEFYSDIYMKRNFKLLNARFNPDHIIVLGDLMDGGREWIRGPLREVMFPKELKRFNHIFVNPTTAPKLRYIPGNHDIGIATNILPEAYARFKKTFGKINYSFKIANHNIIALDTLSYLASAESPYFKKTESFLLNFLENDDAKSPRILLSHVPLYRPDAANCGPLRNNPPLKQAYGYQYQNLINQPLTTYILKNTKPVLVLSGDDHDDCAYVHNGPESEHKQIPEHSIKTFSWLQGNLYPGFALLSLNADVQGLQDTSGFQIGKCALPPQRDIYQWYIYLAGISFIGSFVWVFATRESWAPGIVNAGGSKGKKEDDASRRTTSGGKLSTLGVIIWTIVYGVVAFLEILLSTAVAYAVLLIYDWL